MRSPALALAGALLIAVAWGLCWWFDDSAWSEPSGNTGVGTEKQDAAGADLQQDVARAECGVT